MPFNLILSNPPYGKSSSLGKKIVNKMLECKIAEEIEEDKISDHNSN